MAGTMSINVREMTPDDYDKVYELWMSIQGFGIRSIDDSREGVTALLKAQSHHQRGSGTEWPHCRSHPVRT